MLRVETAAIPGEGNSACLGHTHIARIATIIGWRSACAVYTMRAKRNAKQAQQHKAIRHNVPRTLGKGAFCMIAELASA